MEMMRALDKVAEEDGGGARQKSTRARVSSREAHAAELLKFGRTRGRPDQVCKRLEELRARLRRRGGGLVDLRDSLRSRGVRRRRVQPEHREGARLLHWHRLRGGRPAHPDLGSLCGGGSYDVLPRTLRQARPPATGAAGGVERIALSLGEGAGGAVRAIGLRGLHRTRRSPRGRRRRWRPLEGRGGQERDRACRGRAWASSSRTRAPGVSHGS